MQLPLILLILLIGVLNCDKLSYNFEIDLQKDTNGHIKLRRSDNIAKDEIVLDTGITRNDAGSKNFITNDNLIRFSPNLPNIEYYQPIITNEEYDILPLYVRTDINENNIKYINKIAPSVYEISSIINYPDVYFKGEFITCDKSSKNDINEFKCNSNDGNGTIINTYFNKTTILDSNKIKFDILFDRSGNNTNEYIRSVLPEIFSIGLYRTTNFGKQYDIIVDIMNANDSSNSEARRYVATLWSLFLVLMILFILHTAAWNTWLLPIGQSWLLPVWVLILVGINQILFWSLGILGWLISAGIFFLFTLVSLIFYCITNPCKKAADTHNIDLGGSSDYGFSSTEKSDWKKRPKSLGSKQKSWIIGTFVLMLLIIIVSISIYFIWSQPAYQLYDRKTGKSIIEHIPQHVGNAVSLFYSYDNFASGVQLDYLNEMQTDQCSSSFWVKLETDEEKKEVIQTEYIDEYKIDMSPFKKTKYSEFESANDFFIREIKNTSRLMSYPSDDTIAVSSADSRVVAFQNMNDATTVWIKGTEFTLQKLLDDEKNKDFNGGSLVMFRLAPQDYHRFHSPVTGTVESIKEIDGSIYSVNYEAITSGIGAILNQRMVVMIDSPQFGKVAYIPIGATCVGSIVLKVKKGDAIRKGDEIGYFQFGGSTTAVLFQKDRIIYDSDIVEKSESGVETLLEVRTKIGKAVPAA